MNNCNNINLKEKIISYIFENGPITVEKYMDFCLHDSEFGYYQTQSPFGKNGDFITSPEISQMFGEMLAIWIINAYQKLSFKKKIILCEMGAGNGTLMLDILRTIEKLAPQIMPQFLFTIIETSPKLQAIQKSLLQKYEHSILFIKKIEDLPQMPIFFFANELLDALSIRQFFWRQKSLFERMISYKALQKKFFFTEKKIEEEKNILKYDLSGNFFCFSDNEIFEVSIQRHDLIQKISKHLSQYQGAALFFDYGEFCLSFKDTLQAVSKHNYVDIFYEPGACDLTSHVDFFHLSFTALQENCFVFGLTQKDFLLNLGLETRVQKLSFKKPLPVQNQLKEDFKRLTDPLEMGNLFKVMLITNQENDLYPFSSENRFIEKKKNEK